MASRRGTLLELGLSPLVSAALFLQLCVRLRLIRVNLADKEHRQLYETARRNLALILALGQALIIMYLGLLGTGQSIVAQTFLVFQLLTSTFVLLLFEDLIAKGYGVGSNAINVFVAIHITTAIFWALLSPRRVEGPLGLQAEGLFFSVFGSTVFSDNLSASIPRLFLRPELPNLISLAGTVAVFLVVIYFQGIKASFTLSTSAHSMQQQYELPLLCCSSMPLIMLNALIHNLTLAALFIARLHPSASLIAILGTSSLNAQSLPTSGLIHYISPPTHLSSLLLQPIHTILYLAFSCSACALFAASWIDFSHLNPNEVADQLKK